mgnify:CR=1 FL=1
MWAVKEGQRCHLATLSFSFLGSAFDGDQVLCFQLSGLGLLGNEYMQRAVFKLGADILLRQLVADIEASAAGTYKPLTAQELLALCVLTVGVAHARADAQIAVLQLRSSLVTLGRSIINS